MREIVFRPKADADLENIADYTKAERGDAQAASYLMEIREKITATLRYPAIGSPALGLSSMYRKIITGHHRILYRYTDAEFIVVRIVHKREDVPDALDDC